MSAAAVAVVVAGYCLALLLGAAIGWRRCRRRYRGRRLYRRRKIRYK